jgi:hypothetical protein
LGLPRELVTYHLDIHLLAHLEPEVSHEVFINPWLELTHPSSILALLSEKDKTGTEVQDVILSHRLTKELFSLHFVGRNPEQPDQAHLETVFETGR